MKHFFKILCSLPIILITLYFIPFLGICLILFRYYVYKSRKKYYFIPVCLLVCGFFILVPQMLHLVIKIVHLNIEVPYLDTIITSDSYIQLMGYSKSLITIGTIFLILSFVFKNIFSKLNSSVRNYIQQDLKQEYEIKKENEMKMQEKQEKAKNTRIVHCPHCGSDNILTEKTGICQFCRQSIENKS